MRTRDATSLREIVSAEAWQALVMRSKNRENDFMTEELGEPKARTFHAGYGANHSLTVIRRGMTGCEGSQTLRAIECAST